MNATAHNEPTTGSRQVSQDLPAAVNIERYPIHRYGSSDYLSVVRETREALAREDCARLRGFIRPESIGPLQADAAALRHHAVYRSVEHNPYFSDPPEDAPAWDPRRRMGRRSNGMVPADVFPRDSTLWRIYRSPALKSFLEDCLETRPIHCYADPLGCMVLSVQSAGQEFAWHFDTNDFAVTILIQRPDAGGMFEFAPNIRSAESECYEDVARVLDGRSDRTKVLDLRPGDLQLFRGRHAVHRVTAVEGEKPRMIAVLAYTREPGVLATPERAMQAWGRVHPAQLTAAGRRRRADGLLD